MRTAFLAFGCLMLLPLASHAQTAMEKAGTMANHCQQPVKNQDGSQVKNAQGHIVTMDCPQQGLGSHPSLAPADRRQP